MKFFVFLFTSLLPLAGCALGPLVVHESARSLGPGKVEVLGGYNNAESWVAKVNVGVTNRLDLGAQWERYSIGIRGKFALLNGSEGGFSLATAAGGGVSIGGSHIYGDLIASYLVGQFEPFTAFRFVHGFIDPLAVQNSLFSVTGSSRQWNYLHPMVGTRFWLSPHWHVAAETSVLIPLDDPSMRNSLFFGGALGYRF